MRRKTKIVFAITLLVTVLVTAFSYIYISEFLRQRLSDAGYKGYRLAAQLAYLANSATPELGDTRVDTSNPAAVSKATAYYLSTDRDLNDLMNSIVGSWELIYDAALVGTDGRAILHTNSDRIGKPVADRPEFARLTSLRFLHQLQLVYAPATVYDVRIPLDLNGVAFGSVRVGISTVFLRNELTPHLRRAAVLSLAAILLSLILAAGLSNVALGPLEQISRRLDSVTAGNPEALSEEEPTEDEYGLVTLKIAHLGRQIRDTKEIFSALKDNVDQLMANLQDGLMLFTRDSRVVLVSASVERFLERPRRLLLGRTAWDIFSPQTDLGAMVLEAFQLRRPIAQCEVAGEKGKKVQIALDFIQETGTQIGALLILRDKESVRRLEDEIELSRRLSASGRVTRGVAHEVKNPINAIVLHLQLLQNKLRHEDSDTRRHVDIIDSEIHRLDRVVQILVDFTRPRDLRLEELDLRRLLEEVTLLAAPDAEQHGAEIRKLLPSEPLPVKVDADFMKQALLNVVLNGLQAMPEGGQLTISAQCRGDDIWIEIQDQGSGIPPEVQEKIFELYFTTKHDGSGIGLAQTFQIMQWHDGSVDFESREGVGTTFRLRIPLVGAADRNATTRQLPVEHADSPIS
jgi:signal transduction histidine kinase